MSKSSHLLGFTLIELLVTITIVLLLSTGGFVSYQTFNKRQNLIQSGKQMYQVMRTAQSKRQAGDKPVVCGANELLSYGVQGVAGATGVSLVVHCQGVDSTVGNYPLSRGITVKNSFDVRFVGLYGGVNAATDVAVTSGTSDYVVSAAQGGSVTDVGIQ